MAAIALLAAITLLYAGYNLFIKVSGGHVPAGATTTVVAAICLQLAALATSLVFLGALVARGGHVFALSGNAYLWAVVAGLCIGAAEIGYFYLFSSAGPGRPMAASVAIPIIVSGTIVISMVAAHVALGEVVTRGQMLGGALILLGVVILFARQDGAG